MILCTLYTVLKRYIYKQKYTYYENILHTNNLENIFIKNRNENNSFPL